MDKSVLYNYYVCQLSDNMYNAYLNLINEKFIPYKYGMNALILIANYNDSVLFYKILYLVDKEINETLIPIIFEKITNTDTHLANDYLSKVHQINQLLLIIKRNNKAAQKGGGIFTDFFIASKDVVASVVAPIGKGVGKGVVAAGAVVVAPIGAVVGVAGAVVGTVTGTAKGVKEGVTEGVYMVRNLHSTIKLYPIQKSYNELINKSIDQDRIIHNMAKHIGDTKFIYTYLQLNLNIILNIIYTDTDVFNIELEKIGNVYSVEFPDLGEQPIEDDYKYMFKKLTKLFINIKTNTEDIFKLSRYAKVLYYITLNDDINIHFPRVTLNNEHIKYMDFTTILPKSKIMILPVKDVAEAESNNKYKQFLNIIHARDLVINERNEDMRIQTSYTHFDATAAQYAAKKQADNEIVIIAPVVTDCNTLRGLSNSGNSCYADSVLIALFAQPSEYIKKKIINATVTNRLQNDIDIINEMKHIYNYIHNVGDYKDTIQLRKYYKNNKTFKKCNFNKTGQQSASEYLAELFGFYGMDDDVSRSSGSNSTTLSCIFVSGDENSLNRYNKNKNKNKNKNILYFFDIPNNNFTNYTITTLPYFILSFEKLRIKSNTDTLSFVKTPVNLEETVIVNNINYHMHAIVIHSGFTSGTITRGHYKTWYKCGNKWYLYNDSNGGNMRENEQTYVDMIKLTNDNPTTNGVLYFYNKGSQITIS
jgi:hypothetical protein